MKSLVNFLGVSTCCLVIGALANADPLPLADAELDRVTAGFCASWPACNDTVIPGPGLLNNPISRLGYREGASDPNGPVPTEPPGCETGACGPAGPFPTLEPIAPFEFVPLARVTPLLTLIGFGGGCGGPAGTCAVAE
jgi:hypothetical protein